LGWSSLVRYLGEDDGGVLVGRQGHRARLIRKVRAATTFFSPKRGRMRRLSHTFRVFRRFRFRLRDKC
jgi:hypothetical protein